MRLALPLLLILTLSRSGRGDEQQLELLRLEDLMDLQVRAPSKLTLPVRDAPTVGTVVTREQMESYGWITANDALFKQPGFAPSEDYERVTVSSRGLHEGWNNNHLLILVDGVPHNNNVNLSAYTWDITPLYMVETMELTRGPGSALYGSTAMNGIVALNTVSPSNERPAEGLVRFGSNGTHTYDLLAGHKFKHVGFVLAYNHYETDGNSYNSFDGSGRTDATGALMKFPVNDHRSSDYVWAKVEGYGRLRGLSLQLHYRYWKFGTAYGWLFEVPDRPENMASNTQNLALTYRPPALVAERLQMEWVLMWQRQEVDYDARFHPLGVAGFAHGLDEVLDNETNVMFVRGQVSYRVWRELSLLAGVENRLFLYGGDHVHTSNADLSSSDTAKPYPDGVMRPQAPVLEPVVNRPVDNVGVYGQVATGRLVHRVLSLTAGLRYDYETATYVDLRRPDHPLATRTFEQLSPRVALLIYPWRDLVLKAMFDRAFRAPAPTELFGANTYFISSNVNATKPEQLTSVTLAADLAIVSHLNLRADWYWQQDANPIDFSASAPNLATNLYTLTVTGLELEAIFDVPLTALDVVSGFANYSFVHQLDEQIVDLTIARSGQLAWYPGHVFNLGVAFSGHSLGLSIQGHYQGSVYRRASDSVNPDGSACGCAAYRPAVVADWFTLDARASYRINDWLRLGVQGTNLTNTHGHYLKTDRFPFDYQIEGVRVLATAEITVRLRAR